MTIYADLEEAGIEAELINRNMVIRCPDCLEARVIAARYRVKGIPLTNEDGKRMLDIPALDPWI